MKSGVIFLYLAFFIFFSCISRTEKENVKHEKFESGIDLQELVGSNCFAIEQVMKELGAGYDFIADTSEINVLCVKSVHDSIFFDFTIFDKKYLSLLFDHVTNFKERGIIVCNGHQLLVFDEVGLFDKKDTHQNIIYRKQNIEDLQFYEPLKYRYYLGKDNKLSFIEESWF